MHSNVASAPTLRVLHPDVLVSGRDRFNQEYRLQLLTTGANAFDTCTEYDDNNDPPWAYLGLISVVNLNEFFNSIYVRRLCPAWRLTADVWRLVSAMDKSTTKR